MKPAPIPSAPPLARDQIRQPCSLWASEGTPMSGPVTHRQLRPAPKDGKSAIRLPFHFLQLPLGHGSHVLFFFSLLSFVFFSFFVLCRTTLLHQGQFEEKESCIFLSFIVFFLLRFFCCVVFFCCFIFFLFFSQFEKTRGVVYESSRSRLRLWIPVVGNQLITEKCTRCLLCVVSRQRKVSVSRATKKVFAFAQKGCRSDFVTTIHQPGTQEEGGSGRQKDTVNYDMLCICRHGRPCKTTTDSYLA